MLDNIVPDHELPIQPSEAEITRDRIEVCLDRLEGWKDRDAIALAIVGLVLITASLAFANGCMRG